MQDEELLAKVNKLVEELHRQAAAHKGHAEKMRKQAAAERDAAASLHKEARQLRRAAADIRRELETRSTARRHRRG